MSKLWYESQLRTVLLRPLVPDGAEVLIPI
jgi:hypothetical protein